MTNSVHDMGGMHGFGPVPREDNEPVFHEEWQGRTLGLMMTLAGHLKGNIDNSRSQSEKMSPAEYLSLPYYARWFVRLERNCLANDLVTMRDLSALWNGDDIAANQDARPISGEDFKRYFTSGRSYALEVQTPPQFKVGDAVRAKNMHPKDHTRLPRYARGRLGTVIAEHGGQIYPDTNANFEGVGPERLYTVRFQATELWGAAANPNDTVCIDLWEPYLEAPDLEIPV